MSSISPARPAAAKIKRLQEDPLGIDEFLAQNPTPNDSVARIITCTLLQCKGDILCKKGRNADATGYYEKATKMILGPEFVFPLPVGEGLQNEMYTSRNLYPWDRIALMECCNKMARCLVALKQWDQALLWLEEVNTLYRNGCFLAPVVNFEWIDYNFMIKEYFAERVLAFKQASEIFLELGNTGLAVERLSAALTLAHVTIPSSLDPTKSLASTVYKKKVRESWKLRHPDPILLQTTELKDEKLQVHGSWRKVKLKRSGGIQSRMGFASFIYKDHLYVAGGQHSSLGPFHRDLWCLNLQKLDAWRQLPSYPVSMNKVTLFRGLYMAVHEDRAYLFTGRPEVDFYDLTNNRWNSIMTRFRRSDGRPGNGPWMYPGNNLTDYTVQMVAGKLYIFGGTYERSAIGCNLLCVLDVASGEWTHLSGTIVPKADYPCPGPRKWPASWVNKAQDTIYIMHGMVDRPAALAKNQEHAEEEGYGCLDFWSWNISTRKWRQERINGNPPAPRAEAAFTYNSTWDKAIIFGGYSPSLTTLIQNRMYGFTYYADTFVFSPDTFSFKHVLTRGFPTYRAESSLIYDPTSGKTYLFGGFTNTDYVDDDKHVLTRTFADLWELRVDMPGGGFENVDLEEEKRSATLGPWRRCFACGSAGRWNKCGGTCRGRVFFCDSDCLSEGWKEHKATHGCRKKT